MFKGVDLGDEQAFISRTYKLLKERHLDEQLWFEGELETHFPVIFTGCLDLYLKSSDKGIPLELLLIFFRHLNIDYIRKECLKLVSLGCWTGLSERRREIEFEKEPEIAKLWPRVKETVESKFPSVLIEDFIESGNVAILQLLQYLLLQWSTRRFVSVLLDDKAFVSRCRQKAYNGIDSIALFQSDIFANDPYGELSPDDLKESKLQRIEALQIFLFKLDPSNPLVTESLYMMTKRDKCISLLERHLNDQLSNSVSKEFGWSKEYLKEYIADYFQLLENPKYRVVKTNIFPSLDELESNPSTLILPLSLQFLSIEDYLLRHYYLLRYEFIQAVKASLDNALQRCKPTYDSKKKKVMFDGWSRYTGSIEFLDNSIYVVSLAQATSDAVISEWRKLKVGDNLYLSIINADLKLEEIVCAKIKSVIKERSEQGAKNVIASTTLEKKSFKLKVALDVPTQTNRFNFVLRSDSKDNAYFFLEALRAILSSDGKPIIDAEVLLHGRPTNDVISDPLNIKADCAIINGPPSSGKTTILSKIVKNCVDDKIHIYVPTAEEADHLVKRLIESGSVLPSELVRLGHSPNGVLFGRVQWFLAKRFELLQKMSTINDEFSVSCDQAVGYLQQLVRKSQATDEHMRLLEELKALAPLEHIQSEQFREDYLLRFCCKVAVMTYSYAAINYKSITKCCPKYILMENAHLVPEVYSMLTLFKSSMERNSGTKLLMFGTFGSIGPVCNDTLYEKYSYGQSLYSRLYKLGTCPVYNLQTTYNVPKQCASYYSACTVNHSECIVEAVQVDCEHESPNETKQNVAEAEALVDYYETMDSRNMVILAPFNSQVDLICDVFESRAIATPEIYTIDKYTGGEATMVLCSLTLDHVSPYLQSRLPILFTRAKSRLVLFHNPLLELAIQ